MCGITILKIFDKSFLRERKQYLNEWKYVSYVMIGTFSIFKIAILPKLTYEFSAIVIKILVYFLKKSTI